MSRRRSALLVTIKPTDLILKEAQSFEARAKVGHARLRMTCAVLQDEVD
jgi:hypothetical protein